MKPSVNIYSAEGFYETAIAQPSISLEPLVRR